MPTVVFRWPVGGRIFVLTSPFIEPLPIVVQSDFGGFEEGVIAAVGAVGNVGKAERFLRSFFQAPRGNHQERSWPLGPPFSISIRCGIFHSPLRPPMFLAGGTGARY